MEPVTLILLAIAILSVILIVLITYLLLSGRNGSAKPPRPKTAEEKKEEALRQFRALDERKQRQREQAAREQPERIRGMDTVNQPQSSREPQQPWSTRSGNATPRTGVARSDLRDLLHGSEGHANDGQTPATGTSTVQPADTSQRATPPKGTVPARKKSGTVALNATFFDDDTPPPSAKTRRGKEPRSSQSRATPVASSARAPSTAPKVAPTPRSAPPTKLPPRKPAPTRSKKPAHPPTRPPAKPSTIPRTSTTASADDLAAQFRNTARPDKERLAAFSALMGTIGADDKALYLVEGINSDLMQVQLISLQEITAEGNDSLLDEVIPLVESSSQDVALGAVTALENIGGPIAEQTLLAAVESKHRRVQERAADALVDNATTGLQDQLRDMLHDADDDAMTIAANLLGRFGGTQNAETLQARLAALDEDSAVRPVLQSAIKTAQKRKDSVATGGQSPFDAIQEVSRSGDAEEFAMTLDPELFNPKS